VPKEADVWDNLVSLIDSWVVAILIRGGLRGALQVQLLNAFDKRFFIATQSESVGTHTNIPRTLLATFRLEF
jgi:hypothetical protein